MITVQKHFHIEMASRFSNLNNSKFSTLAIKGNASARCGEKRRYKCKSTLFLHLTFYINYKTLSSKIVFKRVLYSFGHIKVSWARNQRL